ncbi:hypothetical protein [Halalkalibacter oceani]|uniref:Uncharacterized protein n=1 Tax=Halalkalibacter oceani TaxID=1653776 RepID=A0A9X2DM37_9BACI|nr:hypothetical protein [Halalkalibacter oceani]MCM3712615.1 hypothetical protein [Halalkalibacter oceani]
MADKKDSQHEGRDKYFVDVDRMINEGLGGGTVNDHHAGKIEQARDFKEEDPPGEQ